MRKKKKMVKIHRQRSDRKWAGQTRKRDSVCKLYVLCEKGRNEDGMEMIQVHTENLRKWDRQRGRERENYEFKIFREWNQRPSDVNYSSILGETSSICLC